MAYKYLSVSDAAYAGDLPEVTRMISSGELIDEESIIESAVDGGHLHILQYLREKGIPFHENMLQYAVAGGHLHIITYLNSLGFLYTMHAMVSAAIRGYLDMVILFHENGCPLNRIEVNISTGAAFYGKLNILQYLYQQGFTFDSKIAAVCAIREQFACFEYCFITHPNKVEFWNIRHDLSDHMLERIDLNSQVWRQLLSLDLSNQCDKLIQKVNDKKEELILQKKYTLLTYSDDIISDILNYCVCTYY